MASMNRVAMAERGSIIASLQKSKMVDDDSSNLYPPVGAKQGEPVGVNRVTSAAMEQATEVSGHTAAEVNPGRAAEVFAVVSPGRASLETEGDMNADKDVDEDAAEEETVRRGSSTVSDGIEANSVQNTNKGVVGGISR